MAIPVIAIFFFGMRPVSRYAYAIINFSNYAGDEMLRLDSAHYQNELGQDFTVTNFKYYVGNLKLYSHDTVKYTWNQYFLINEADPKSRKVTLPMMPEGKEKYTSISFTLGVDSAMNCSGAQSGALDPVNAMFWMWNTGYIFVKLEGKAAASKSPGHIFEYHIGGYRAPSNCIRTIMLDLTNNPLKSVGEEYCGIQIKTDILELLKTPMTIDFSKLSSVTDFHHAAEIADNYTDMFTVLKVENAY
ncbi:MAG: MbnP family protein [Bacteroidia bacterium]